MKIKIFTGDTDSVEQKVNKFLEEHLEDEK